MTTKPFVDRGTARELLASRAGEAHAEHTVLGKSRPSPVLIAMHCSCGGVFTATATKENAEALRNVRDQVMT